MIDTRGKPVYQEESCPVCHDWQARQSARDAEARPRGCHTCGADIPRYEEMRGAGYESQAVDHWHFRDLGGLTGLKAIHRELCLECYRRDWQEVYPDAPLAV